MKRSAYWMWIGIGICFICAGRSQALTLVPQKIAPGVYAFIGDLGSRTYDNEGMNANTGFIVTSDNVIVIDSGSSFLVAKQIHRAIMSVTKLPIKFVVNTGGQDHRWLGNVYFQSIGAEIIAQRAAVADMRNRGDGEIEELRQTLMGRVVGTKPVLASRIFDVQDNLKLGGIEIQIIYFQGGHTPGDSVVWLPQKGVLFAGDLVFVDRLLGILPISNTHNWVTSFDAMEKLNPHIIVPGHGQLCDLAKAKRDTKDYLVMLRDHMRKAVAHGQDLQTAINTLGQERFRHLINYETLKGGNASRTYLEIEME